MAVSFGDAARLLEAVVGSRMVIVRANHPEVLVAAPAGADGTPAGCGLLTLGDGDEGGEGSVSRGLGQGHEEPVGRGRGQGPGDVVESLGIHSWAPPSSMCRGSGGQMPVRRKVAIVVV